MQMVSKIVIFTAASLGVAGCEEILSSFQYEEDLRRVSTCEKYISWKTEKYEDLEQMRKDKIDPNIMQEEFDKVDRISEDFIAYCDRDPETIPEVNSVRLESRMDILYKEEKF